MPSDDRFIRWVMFANALSCVGFGAVFCAFPVAVAEFLGSPPVLLIRIIGIGLILNAAHLIIAARRVTLRRAEIIQFTLGDAAWVIASVALVLSGVWIGTSHGVLSTLAVALLVAGFGLLQWIHLRRSRPGRTLGAT